MRVCIVGGGLAGLCAAKHSIQNDGFSCGPLVSEVNYTQLELDSQFADYISVFCSFWTRKCLCETSHRCSRETRVQTENAERVGRQFRLALIYFI